MNNYHLFTVLFLSFIWLFFRRDLIYSQDQYSKNKRSISNNYSHKSPSVPILTRTVNIRNNQVKSKLIKNAPLKIARSVSKVRNLFKKGRYKNRYVEKLSRLGISSNIVEDWFEQGVPMAIHHWSNGSLVVIDSITTIGTGRGVGKILNLSDEDKIDDVLERRNLVPLSLNTTAAPKNMAFELLSSDSYQVISFIPGKTDDKDTLIERPQNIHYSADGPDHDFRDIDPANLEAIKELRERTISLGHGGEIVLAVKKGGRIFDNEGADFVIYENPMRIPGVGIYQEFAHVGVASADAPQKFYWFHCNPKEGQIFGCAGVVPTDEGGDAFDLAILGLKDISYIKIKDTNLNFNNSGKNTEGFDLDAIKLINAYIEVKEN
ncbi:MAG: hypothetical protein HN353_06540 [Bdellovibrionales bacterium]|jgi:hypothetical protein|nr:hypothetical protein [Bdellovibrionales bacterium]MBT3526292.1 hypothetical protein [Bdellovibrionales bacterium]MBT7670201.1 hypothetical protein [Bdellovibrionales bacterium]MBT7765867.1 hypothetical protein [Bdellovibrionales bacterium]